MEIKHRISDQTKSILVRMWFAGIVCFFIAFTPIGGGQAETNAFLIQMIIMLSFGLFITNLVIVNPIIRGMFKTKLDRKSYYSQNVFIRSSKHIIHFFSMVLITTLILLTYVLFNTTLSLFNLTSSTGRPLIMLEPITFGILFGLYYYGLETLSHRFMPKEKLK